VVSDDDYYEIVEIEDRWSEPEALLEILQIKTTFRG